MNEDLAGWGFVSSYVEFVCECGDAGCIEHVPLTHAEYERVRRDGTHFLVAPGHELERLERVVERHDRYHVVEKLAPGARIAAAADPRG